MGSSEIKGPVFRSSGVERAYHQAKRFCQNVKAPGIKIYSEGRLSVIPPNPAGNLEVRVFTGTDPTDKNHSLPAPMLLSTVDTLLPCNDIFLVPGNELKGIRFPLSEIISKNTDVFPALDPKTLSIRIKKIEALLPTAKFWLRWCADRPQPQSFNIGMLIQGDQTLYWNGLIAENNDFLSRPDLHRENLSAKLFSVPWLEDMAERTPEPPLKLLILPGEINKRSRVKEGIMFEFSVQASAFGAFTVVI